MSPAGAGVGGAMRRGISRLVGTVGLLTVFGASGSAAAHQVKAHRSGEALRFEGESVGRRQVPQAGPHVGSHGSTVMVDAHGLLVAERNAGALVRADAQGQPIASLQLHEGVAQIVHDGAGAIFVADRGGDRIIRVDAPDARTLRIADEAPLLDPHGLALTPDGRSLLVTSVADHALVAFDAQSLKELWRAKLAPEPRGVAISADGTQAVVGFLSSGSLAVVDLSKDHHPVAWRSLNPRDHVGIEQEELWEEEVIDVAVVREARSRFQVPTDSGRRQARNAFAVAYVGHDLIAAPHQLSTSQMKRIPSPELQDSYGGGPQNVPPIVHRLAMLEQAEGRATSTGFAHLDVHQPRAVAYDPEGDTLYVAGYGDDRIAAVGDVSSPAPYLAWVTELSGGSEEKPDQCGVDGLSLDGDSLWVHCELTRRLIRLQPERFALDDKPWVREKDGVLVGPELAASLRAPEVERGAELFRRGRDWRISSSGVMACASCHPEGRQDGLSWRLGHAIVQTPMLAGRVEGTAPYKWSGSDADLQASFRHTIERLGGATEWGLSGRDVDDLAAYVRSLPAPRTPSITDEVAVARGQKLFHDELDCSACHSGERLTDGSQYPLASRGLEETDTPSLIGLAHTAPYYHDGSALDLEALLTDRGNVHDMSDMTSLSPTQVQDLAAYLRTL